MMDQNDELKDWNNRSVLIAEDEDSNFKYLQIVLRHTGVKIFRAKSGKEVIRLFREHPYIDLILMDIKMPELNGLDAAKKIRAFNQQVPIVALTAYAMSDDREISLKAGCNDYISKPVQRSRIFSVLSRYLDRPLG
ncbi:MAG TPA: response regulator [Bacteroidales bacterium]|nr:response regulator [Bacteroidales bacterium]